MEILSGAGAPLSLPVRHSPNRPISFCSFPRSLFLARSLPSFHDLSLSASPPKILSGAWKPNRCAEAGYGGAWRRSWWGHGNSQQARPSSLAEVIIRNNKDVVVAQNVSSFGTFHQKECNFIRQRLMDSHITCHFLFSYYNGQNFETYRV